MWSPYVSVPICGALAVLTVSIGDWAATFHRIPKLTDSTLHARGAHRVAPIGLTDVAKGNVYGDFEEWLEDSLWPALDSQPSANSALALDSVMDMMEISTNARASQLRHDVSLGIVMENKKLTAEGEPEKWHMEVQL